MRMSGQCTWNYFPKTLTIAGLKECSGSAATLCTSAYHTTSLPETLRGLPLWSSKQKNKQQKL
uniref:La ribonucleoprotein 7, transcriptional regulator n=1 Tax=Rousettus aegyptiacus TaxID=9407 RepID=A0A7J8BSI8_ROUAE|nr:La ribonucleoprotein 7, transcriptional regulator [Rousettus aegyptiacus]